MWPEIRSYSLLTHRCGAHGNFFHCPFLFSNKNFGHTLQFCTARQLRVKDSWSLNLTWIVVLKHNNSHKSPKYRPFQTFPPLDAAHHEGPPPRLAPPDALLGRVGRHAATRRGAQPRTRSQPHHGMVFLYKWAALVWKQASTLFL